MHFSASTLMVPYFQQFSAMVHKMHFFSAIWDRYVSYIYAETASIDGDIWDEFSEQHQHQA